MSESAPSHHTRKTGRLMLIIAWLVGMLLLTQMFGHWERRQQNPNQSPLSQRAVDGRIEVALHRNRQGHYLTQGRINGEAVTFLLDTGATDIVVPAALAQELGLQHLGRGYASTANGVVEIERTELESVSIGDIILYNVPASINPGMRGEDEVLLGMSALRQLDFAQRDGVLTLTQ